MSKFPIAKKFDPAIHQPKYFFEPPTAAVRPKIIKIIEQTDERLSRLANDRRFAEAYGLQYHAPLEFKYGTEFEILALSPQTAPDRHNRNQYGHNPNYTAEHRALVKDVRTQYQDNPNYTAEHLALVKDVIQKMQSDLGDILQYYDGVTKMGRLGMEIRTRPMPLPNYLQAMDRIGAWVRQNAKDMHFIPIVYSEHGHVSCFQNGKNMFNKDHPPEGEIEAEPASPSRMLKAAGNGVIDIETRALPLLCLPEEIEKYKQYRGLKCNYNPLRAETRLNSSSYAADPYLNLALRQLGIYNGLRTLGRGYGNEHLETNETSYKYRAVSHHYYGGGITYDQAIESMRDDPVLSRQNNLGKSLLNQLTNIIALYPDVTSGKRTLDGELIDATPPEEKVEDKADKKRGWLNRFALQHDPAQR